MGQYIGLFYENETDEIKHIKHLLEDENSTKAAYFQDQHFIFKYEISENDVDEESFFENDQLAIFFQGECYNKEHLMEKAEINQPSASISFIVGSLYTKYDSKAFSYIRGKFSVVVWDKNTQALSIARDHFGVKTIFYKELNSGILFAPNKKAITSLIENEQINDTALQHYLSFQYVPEPMTLTKGIQMVEPATILQKKLGGSQEITKYWQSTFNPILKEKNEWIDKIRETMFESVQRHMQGDIQIGSFLSGGIDSTLVVSIAKQLKPDIKTFSVGFAREGFSEVGLAEETADALQLENISYTISPEEYVEKLPEIMWHLDDPLADPSCVPLYFVGREAKKHVDYALSGEGSDELFGGYNIYREPNALKPFDYIPRPVKDLLASIAHSLPEQTRGKSFLERGTTPLKERYIGNAKMFEEVEKEAILKNYDPSIPYTQITAPLYEAVKDEPLVTQMQYIDINTWLRGDILLKAEKMSGANNLEIRMPFLDKEVFNLASSIPIDLKIANGTTKQILREASRGIIPDNVLDRKKLGFPVPIRHWLKRELKSWAIELIEESETDHILHKDYVLGLLHSHCTDKGDYSRKIWTLLMFMLWHQIFVEKKYDFS